MSNPAVEFFSVSKSYGGHSVLTDLSLSLAEGEIYGLIGESGSGKTTCLRLMNGMEAPEKGTVKLQGEPINYKKSEELRRRTGYSIQGSGLFPHFSVFENVSVIGWRSGWNVKKRQKRTEELLELVNLKPSEVWDKKPHELSGGQRQRVGLARALFMNPKVLFMDEPFGALDPLTRAEIQDFFISLQKKYQLTVVLVTHDLAEAFKMSDELILLNHGRVEQRGAPNELLLNPATPFVKSFLKTHSPGHVLEGIKLYSVINNNIWVCSENENKFCLYHLRDRKRVTMSNLAEVTEFLSSKGQKYYFKVNESGQFLAMVTLAGQQLGSTIQVKPLVGRLSLRTGLSEVLTTSHFVPVVDDNGRLIGCFSQEAVDALA